MELPQFWPLTDLPSPLGLQVDSFDNMKSTWGFPKIGDPNMVPYPKAPKRVMGSLGEGFGFGG